MAEPQPKLVIEKRRKEYFICNLPPYYVNETGPFTECGPYKTRSVCISDLRGLKRFFQTNKDV